MERINIPDSPAPPPVDAATLNDALQAYVTAANNLGRLTQHAETFPTKEALSAVHVAANEVEETAAILATVSKALAEQVRGVVRGKMRAFVVEEVN
jgi:hypothetical protein